MQTYSRNKSEKPYICAGQAEHMTRANEQRAETVPAAALSPKESSETRQEDDIREILSLQNQAVKKRIPAENQGFFPLLSAEIPLCTVLIVRSQSIRSIFVIAKILACAIASAVHHAHIGIGIHGLRIIGRG